ncbi:hypothetical protein [Catenulispora sp. GAS73]|uniref:hypothetical protein n=1 Tax=Catenulispora sp. GAS73 TaxID=3156269 RepID=UPI0035155D7C
MNPALPAGFLTAVAAQATPGSAVASFVAKQATALTNGDDRRRLLSALLAAPFQTSAPSWLLEAATDQGLDGADDHWAGSGIELAASALSHPDCTEAMRQDALQRCTEAQLASFGGARRPHALALGVATELRRRSSNPTPMTRELFTEPTPAQLILRTGHLNDVVFDTAFEFLPTHPGRPDRAVIDDEDRYKVYREEVDAWTAMLRQVLEHHPDRHEEIVSRTEGGPANYTVRHLLLGTMPWTVAPELLKALALAELDSFRVALLATQLSRALRDGESKREVEQRFANRIEALAANDQRRMHRYFEEDGLDPEWGCQEAELWISGASDTWRLLLNPGEAKPRYGGDPHPWRTAPADLADLGRAFAQTTAAALEMWEPDPDRLIRGTSQLRWVADVLTHLPEISDSTKAAVRRIVADARNDPHRNARYVSFEERNAIEALIARIEKIIADPAPDTAARRAALGDRAQITVRALTTVPSGALAVYLDRHAGDDVLVEKALLAIASSSYGPRNDFQQVLNRHSDPQRAIADLTRDLRRRLGGNPPARESWAREVLALPFCDVAMIRALPARTTLQIGGGGAGRTHPEVLNIVNEALGEDTAAWTRLAESPISHTGPNAWLRLGDVLDAARAGGSWPTPPPTRYVCPPDYLADRTLFRAADRLDHCSNSAAERVAHIDLFLDLRAKKSKAAVSSAAACAVAGSTAG